MSNPYFNFKQFTVNQDKSAMKVGTDAVLLGAWCDVKDKRTALDIGTGTGILSLMMAQRNASMQITAIDIDDQSIIQAHENVSQSSFRSRINIERLDFNDATFNHKFDLIISNPPYHEEEVFCPNEERNNARHTSSLSFETLISRASQLLNDNGTFSVIIPTTATEKFYFFILQNNMCLRRRTDIFTTPKKQPKRTLLEFSHISSPPIITSLYIRDDSNNYSPEYIQLTKDFYLDL